jgi:hypothetical protein
MVTSLWDMAVIALSAATVWAQTTSPLPQLPGNNRLPGSGNIVTQTSSTLVTTPFTADPTAQQQPTGEPKVEAFIYNNAQCVYAGESLWYRLYIGNVGSAVARSLNIQFQYPAGTSLLAAAPSPERQDEAKRLLEWSLANLPPAGGYAQYSVTAQVQTVSAKQSVLIVTYLDAQGQVKQVVSVHTIPGECGQPDAPTRPRGAKSPAIYCDPAETSCVPSFPDLGERFGFGVSKPVLGNDKPILGVRFQEAFADIVPGDCRVAADDVIKEPEYHDALNRLSAPAAFYMQPLYDSGVDFKRLVHEDNLLGTSFTRQAREKLYALHVKMWGEHTNIVDQVLRGSLSSEQARTRLEALLSRWQGSLDDLQDQLRVQYGQIQSSRAAKFPPVATKAVENAKLSMQRACNIASDGGLAAKLPAVRQAYEQALSVRTALFAQTQSQFRNLTGVKGLWQQRPYPALQAYGDGNAEALKTYRGQQGSYAESLFLSGFRAYQQHQAKDLEAFDQVRLEAFEKALDGPKREATSCEKDKVFRQPVETTFCESNDSNSIPQVLGPAAVKERVKNSDSRPAEGITEQQARQGVKINDAAVKGEACNPTAELPGAPWWSKGCECQCNEQVAIPDGSGNFTFVACQDEYEIVRHDTAVESQTECFAQAEHHPDLYF